MRRTREQRSAANKARHRARVRSRSNPYLTVGRRKVWVARYSGSSAFKASRSAWPSRHNPLTLSMRGRRVRVHTYRGGGLLMRPYRNDWPDEESIRAYSDMQVRRMMRPRACR